ncbi:uncharacterized protein LOC141605941 [Silene latifolia]|uniref:uncharacterized protein LOC141605941 n=1 Tax=Silene latifolia TaxID=37657 RepID=UPI003D788EE6
MLDGLLGRSAFYSKSKSLIKQARTRIEVVRRKRNATQKFLRKDVADLLANGLESNAFARADGLITDLILCSCYEFIDHVCEIVLKHLPVLQKLRDCPEDCREAVASLMYAAARFSDVPELRDLRNLFQERYGSSLEMYVNQKLAENISTKPPTVEKKIQLLQDIALEFSVRWDSRNFEERMSKSVTEKKPQNDPVTLNMVKNKVATPVVVTVPRTVKAEAVTNKQSEASPQIMEGDIDGRRQMKTQRDNLPSGKDDLKHKVSKSPEFSRDRSKLRSNREETTQTLKEHDISFQKKKPDTQHTSNGIDSSPPVKNEHAEDILVKSVRKREGAVADGSKSNFRGGIPPPYMKPRKNKHKPDEDNDTLTFNPNPGSNGNKAENLQTKADNPENGDGPPRFTEIYYKDESTVDFTPRRRSHRRKHSRSASSQDDEMIGEERILRRVSTSRRKNGSRKGLQILVTDDDKYKKDDEEKMIDKLLLHYSKKPSSDDPGKSRKINSVKLPTQHQSNAADGTHMDEELTDLTLTKSRSFCVPSRQVTEPMQEKVFARAASFQDTPAKHVHPKLPDYDDLAARFAALRASKD